MNKFDVFIDTHKFIRTLNMKKYFLSHPSDTSNQLVRTSINIDSGLRNKSVFNPQNANNHFVEVFKNMVIKDIEELPLKKTH